VKFGAGATVNVDQLALSGVGAAIAAPGPDDLAAGDTIGEYQIVEPLGEGGMGAVYGAVHTVIGKRAAIKLLRRELCHNPEVVARFVQEARAVNQIGHAGIVDIFGFGALPDGRNYYAMEWLRGESLGTRLERGRLGRADACAILDQIIAALEAAHGQGIIHRDLKPDNVFLVEGPQLRTKLLDFGIAKLTGVADRRIERTRTGSLVGTPQYIAPEQARGAAIDARADLYALGILSFEMFTGRLPFEADNAADLIAKHLTEVPPRARTIAPELPAELDEILAAMLSKDAAGRPPLARIRAVFARAGRAPIGRPIDPALGEQLTPRATPAAIAAEARAAVAERAEFQPPAAPPLELHSDEPHAPRPRAERGGVAPATGDAPIELAIAPAAPAGDGARSGRTLGVAVGLGVAAALAVGAIVVIPRLRGGATRDERRPAPVPPPAVDPPPALGPAEGTLEITLDGAPRAVLAIDGHERDLWKGARTVLPISTGHHTITVTAAGFAPFAQALDVASDGRVVLSARLRPR
jgi:serine/threonine-protein kinase